MPTPLRLPFVAAFAACALAVQAQGFGTRVQVWTNDSDGPVQQHFELGGEGALSSHLGNGGPDTGSIVPVYYSTTASLAEGALHAYAAAGVPWDGTVTTKPFRDFFSRVEAEMWDTVHLVNSTDEDITIPFRIGVDGTSQGVTATLFQFSGFGMGANEFREYEALNVTVAGSFVVPAHGTLDDTLYARFRTSGYGDNHYEFGQSDYLHTVRFSWDLPASGISYTSDSKTFLTAPVPEPASMVALGVGATGLLRRRRMRGR